VVPYLKEKESANTADAPGDTIEDVVAKLVTPRVTGETAADTETREVLSRQKKKLKVEKICKKEGGLGKYEEV
jgi:hypothetical protein